MAHPKRLNKMRLAFARNHPLTAAKAPAGQRLGRMGKAAAFAPAVYKIKQSPLVEYQQEILVQLQDHLARAVELACFADVAVPATPTAKVLPAQEKVLSAGVASIRSLQPFVAKIDETAKKQGIRYRVVDMASVRADAVVDQDFTEDSEVCFVLLMPEHYDMSNAACFQETVGNLTNSDVFAFDAMALNADVVMRSRALKRMSVQENAQCDTRSNDELHLVGI